MFLVIFMVFHGGSLNVLKIPSPDCYLSTWTMASVVT